MPRKSYDCSNNLINNLSALETYDVPHYFLLILKADIFIKIHYFSQEGWVQLDYFLSSLLLECKRNQNRWEPYKKS